MSRLQQAASPKVLTRIGPASRSGALLRGPQGFLSRYAYGIWEYRGETLPPSATLWTATDANFIASPGTMWVPVPEDEPVTIWYALVVSDPDGGVCLTPADYLSDPLPTASVTIQPRGPSDQVTYFSVTVGRDEAQDVPQGWFIFAFDVPADPDSFCVDFFRRPADQNGTPIGEWGVDPVCSLQAPGRQDGSWAIPAEEHWIFKAVAVNDLGERNDVDPPTCFVTIAASASGVKAGRLDPGAVDGPLSVDVLGRVTVGLNAILSDHIDSLAVEKIFGLIRSSQIGSILASKIAGTISSDQIGSIAASKIAGTIQSSQIESVAATKITGTLQATQIASIAATKISGSISSNQIESLTATKITGSITSAQIESIAASKITGSISSEQIASIAASKITGTISASQIGSINATSITGTIVANQIGAVNASVVVISQSIPFSNVWTAGSVTAVGSIYSDTGNVVASNGTLRGAGLHITGSGIYIDSPSSFRSAIGAAASPVAWAEVTGKPSVFPPDVHSHNYAAASHTHSVQVSLGVNKSWIQDLNSNWYEVVTDVWVSSVTVT